MGGERSTNEARSICPFCGVGCALRHDERSGTGRGEKGAVNRRGELCPKGVAAYDVVDHPDRLTRPLVREDGDDDLRPATWTDAMDRIEEGFTEIVDRHGPDALAFFASSGCTNEENYLLQRIARAVGTNNVDNCARLCHSSTVAAMGARFGTGAMTNTLADLGEADVFLVAGANPAEQHPVIFSSYLYPAMKAGTTLIHVDPRANETTRHADLHLPVKPGHDIPLLNAMCAVVVEEGLVDEPFLAERVREGAFETFRERLAEVDVDACADLAGVDPTDLREAARIYGSAGRAAAFTGMGMSQHHYGTANVHALLNLALLAGNVGKRGAGVNPLRGKNNVQGTGDVGALPDSLPGYAPVSDPAARDRVAEVWGFDPPGSPGLTEVEATHAFGDEVRGAFVLGENVARTEPNAARVAADLDALDLLVVQDVVPTATTAHADVVLPASSWAEKSGTVTNTDRQVQRMRPAASPPGEARPDLAIIHELGTRLTDQPLPAPDPETVFDEMRRVNPHYGGMSYAGIGEGSQRWPFPEGASEGVGVLHAETFGTGEGRTDLVWVDHEPPADEVGDDELVLTTGRVLAHYNSGAITRRSEVLSRRYPDDPLRIHPDDAAARGIEEGDPVVVENGRGRVETTANVTPAVRPGVVFLTFHFDDPAANALTGDALDPVAKIPEYKHSAVRVEGVG